jgi:mRNA interferase RelE/StbE
MKWRVEIAKTALEPLEKISDLRVRKKLLERIEQRENDPEGQGKPLRNELSGLLTARAIGQRYRIMYKVVNERVIVVVVTVGIRREGDRSDIYRIAEHLLRSGLMTL